MKIHKDLDGLFTDIANIFSSQNCKDIKRYLSDILVNVKLNLNSRNNRAKQSSNPNKIHPVNVYSGEIYFITMSGGVGTELIGDHLGIVVQNKKANLYSSKVNVVPIEGDGTKINKNYNVELTNADLESGHIDKDPSRIITTDILTIDKCRLSRKIGKVNDAKYEEIKKYLKKQLDL